MIFFKRLIKNWALILKDFFSTLGFLWLLIELISYFFPDFSSLILRSIGMFGFIIIIGILFGILKNIPKSIITKKIRDKDSCITIKVGDIFKKKGSIVVPINDYFDISLDGNVKKAKSVLCKLISDYYFGKDDHLKNDIRKKINLENAPYPSGTVIEIEQGSKKFFLLVNSKKKRNNRVFSDIDDFMNSLNGLWDHLATETDRDECVNIPLINTQHGRNPDITRDIVIKQIIDTFIEAMKHKMICENIVIYIHPSDLKKGGLNFEQLCEYLDFKCANYKDVKFDSKKEGAEIEASSISQIKS